MAKKKRDKKPGLIARIFPQWALKRNIARARLARLEKYRSLDAVSGSRARYSFPSTSLNINSEVADNIVGLREQIRRFELENGNVSGAFRRIKKNVVGHGIRLNAEIIGDASGTKSIPKISEEQAETANHLAEKYFNKVWNREADKRLILPFYGADGIQGIVEHALLRDNEVLVIGRTSSRVDRLIPYCLEVLEADRLQTPPGERNNPEVENGIHFDLEGAPKSYFVLREHPGNTLSGLRDDDFEEIPAYNDNGTKKVMFLFNPIRPEQTRAFSLMASALKDIQDADRYMEAEKLAALEDACMFGTVTTEDMDGWDTDNVSSDRDDYDRIHEFAPNEIKYLLPGEKLDVHRPTRPGTQFDKFIDQIWRGPANSLDVPPEVFLQKWNGMNYSNARTVLLQFYATCRERQRFLINNLCIPVYENVFRWFVSKGLVSAPSFYTRKYDWLEHSWIAPGWQWVDPKKEADGKAVEVNLGTENVTDIILSQGEDPRNKLERRAREKRWIKDLEAKYDVELFAETAPARSNTETEEPDDE
jgi:lambda family phage portal protein